MPHRKVSWLLVAKLLVMNLSKFASCVVLVAASALSTSASLSSAQVADIGRQLKSARTAEVPSVVAQLISAAPKAERSDTAVAAFKASFKARPATLTSALTAAVQAVPESAVALVEAALQLAPSSATTIVRTAADAAPEQAQAIRVAASKVEPKKAVLFEREVAASAASRRSVGSSTAPVGGAFAGGTTTVTPLPNVPTTRVYAQPGYDPRRHP